MRKGWMIGAALCALLLTSCVRGEDEGALPPDGAEGSGAVETRQEQPEEDGQTPAREGQLTAFQKQADLEYLYDTLAARHKNLFASLPRKDYEEAKEALSQRLGELSDVEFYHALREFVALAGDAHTMMGVDWERISQYDLQEGLPFAVAAFDGGWRLLLSDVEQADYLGMEVAAIDGVPMAEVYRRASALISHDNETWLRTQFSNTINFLDTLRYLGVTDSGEGVTLTLVDEGREVEVVFPAMTGEEMMEADIRRFQAEFPQTGFDGSYYRFLQLGEEALFLQYNMCAEDPEKPMADFVEEVRGVLNLGDYGKVLVDLRNNSGGNSSILDPLTAMLAEQRKERGFALYALIGEDTFSSGLMNAVDLANIGALLVGQPTGGTVNHYGEVQMDALPNMPLVFSYSTSYFELVPGYEGDSLLPDLAVEQSFAGYREGVDEVVEAVLNH